EKDAGIYRLDDHGANERAEDREAPPEQGVAADHDGEDRVELQPEPGIVGVGATDVGGDDEPGDGGEEPGDQVDRHQQDAGVQPGEGARARVHSNRLDQQAERGLAHDQPGDGAGGDPDQ